ncbi:Rieske 2Fe-2S domain-containing protein [Streptomyces sp. NPDC004126]|uniref:Rieske 2Fe-2S domain-containing protein n=1 Tax=Streptomyces sp. NPDC004126 TaxID=3390695 RepID=UPI003CFDFEAE
MSQWRIRPPRPPAPESPYARGEPPLPYPEGWFVLAPSRDVKPGQVVIRRFMGEDVVVYRTARGRVRATRPYCPHLGAHLGHGGRVAGETIVCPFHGFAFDATGTAVCAGPGYTGLPVQERLAVLDCEEVNGVILAWYGHDPNRPPAWTIPPLLRVPAHDMRFTRTTVASHPQETGENTVDSGHAEALHGFTGIDMHTPPVADKHQLSLALTVTRRYPPLGTIAADIAFTFHGLGFIHLELRVPVRGLSVDVVVSPRPTAPWQVELLVGTAMAVHPGEGPLGRLPRSAARLACWTATWLNLRALSSDTSADLPIWTAKRYTDPPRLAPGDGPIGPYRKWARQFYPDTAAQPGPEN